MSTMDFLNFENEPLIKIKIGNEVIEFSDQILNIKKRLFKGEETRNLLITNIAIYKFKKREIKRRYKIEDLYGITYSTESSEFIIHLNENDYDFRLSSEKRDSIIRILQSLYEKLKNTDLLFCVKNEKDLSKYEVTKKERRMNPYFFKLDKNNLTPIKEFFKNFVDVNKIKNEEIKEKVKNIIKENNCFNIIYPEDEKFDSKDLVSLIFESGDQLLKCGIICKNSDIFNTIVNKIFEREPRLKENFNYFLCNGNRVNEYKSIKDNNIKDGNVIILNNFE